MLKKNVKKSVKRFVSVLLAFTLAVTMSVIPKSEVHAATSGIGYGNSMTVAIDRSLLNKRGKQYATVKVNFKNYGIGNGAKVHVLMQDENWNWICEYDVKSNRTVKFNLGDDHRVYHITFKAPSAAQRYIGLKSWKLVSKSKCTVY